MSQRQITLRLDKRWYDALSRRLGDQKLEDKLNAYLEEMISQLPAQEVEKISREIREEQQADEARHPLSAFRVTQDGQTDHLLAKDGAAMDAYHTALRLRDYLLRKSNSTEQFVQTIPAVMEISPDEFRQYADELCQGTGRMKAVLDIDLDQGKFSALDAAGCREVYAIRDVCVAARRASQKDFLQWEQRLDIFAEYLEPRMIRCETPEMEPPAGPSM